MTIHERRRKALFDWASGQRADYLASILVYVLSRSKIKMLIEDHNIKVPKN